MVLYHGTTDYIRMLNKNSFLSSSENIALSYVREYDGLKKVYIFWFDADEVDICFPGKDIVPAWVSRVEKIPLGVLVHDDKKDKLVLMTHRTS